MFLWHHWNTESQWVYLVKFLNHQQENTHTLQMKYVLCFWYFANAPAANQDVQTIHTGLPWELMQQPLQPLNNFPGRTGCWTSWQISPRPQQGLTSQPSSGPDRGSAGRWWRSWQCFPLRRTLTRPRNNRVDEHILQTRSLLEIAYCPFAASFSPVPSCWPRWFLRWLREEQSQRWSLHWFGSCRCTLQTPGHTGECNRTLWSNIWLHACYQSGENQREREDKHSAVNLRLPKTDE